MIEAVISDVHANLAALQAVLEDIDSIGVDRIVCLGDTVGYGPDPADCLRLVMERCDLALLGNHEFAVLHDADGFNPIAEAAIQWTRDQIRDKEILKFLQGLKSARLEGDRLYVHGSVRDPLLDYVREAENYLSFRRMVQEIRETFTLFNLCFTGHNHRKACSKICIRDRGFILSFHVIIEIKKRRLARGHRGVDRNLRIEAPRNLRTRPAQHLLN